MECMKINKVLIVGGGTSGWMTAAALSTLYSEQLEVSLVESDKISTVGVGESTIILFNRFLEMLDIQDEDWMKECNATYKTSIRFNDFRERNTTFEYPFGGRRDMQSLVSWAQLAAKYNMPPDSFAAFMSTNFILARENRLTENKHKVLPFHFPSETAYHFDAGLFGQWLKNNYCKNVNKFVDDIVGVEKNEDGSVRWVKGTDGKNYVADLYIDCTGFQSLLLEKEMGSEFLSYKSWLSNDKAIAAHIPYEDKENQLNNVTTCTAIENGWVWDIPLWNRIGTGYVYSSDFVDDDTAEQELKKHLGKQDIDIRKIDIRHGIRKDGWVKNVLGIGLSYAFVEPLESTSLVSTHLLIQKLVELLDREHFHINGFDIDGWNYSSQAEIDSFRDFVSLHYKLSSRTDTPYWKYHTEEKSYFNLNDQGYTHHKPNGPSLNAYEKLHLYHSVEHIWTADDLGMAYIMAGMGNRPFGNYYLQWIFESDPEAEGRLKGLYEDWKEKFENSKKFVLTQPTSYEFLQQKIYGVDN